MSRLIDADMVISIAKGEVGKDDLSKILWLVSHVPTAYKVDKVVERLEEFREEMEKFGCSEILIDIIEVVKGGGVDA